MAVKRLVEFTITDEPVTGSFDEIPSRPVHNGLPDDHGIWMGDTLIPWHRIYEVFRVRVDSGEHSG